MSFIILIDISVGFQWKGVMILKGFEGAYSKEIYKKLKHDILSSQIKDGDFLTLSELAEKYNVSKTPVRDALGALEIEGYLKSLPRKGYLVKPVTNRSIRESFQMRLIAEIAAAKIAIKTADDSELMGILELASNFPETTAKDSFFSFNKLNDTFHMAIIKATHNSLFVEIGLGIMENLSRILMADSHELEFINEKHEHIKIAESLVKRDFESTEKLISQHIFHLQERVCSRQREV